MEGTESAERDFAEACAKIAAQNRALMARLDACDFDAGRELDHTRNGGGYHIQDFFDLLKLFPHGKVPIRLADEMIATTDELLEKISARYPTAEVEGLVTRAGLAFRRSKRIWRIRDPKVQLQPAAYAAMLDKCIEEIVEALDNLNLELNKAKYKGVAGPVPAPKAKRRRAATKPAKAPRKLARSKDWNKAMAARLLCISTRQLRNYRQNPPAPDWPGWEDPVALRQWKSRQDDRDAMHQAMARRLGYKEGFSESRMQK